MGKCGGMSAGTVRLKLPFIPLDEGGQVVHALRTAGDNTSASSSASTSSSTGTSCHRDQRGV